MEDVKTTEQIKAHEILQEIVKKAIALQEYDSYLSDVLLCSLESIFVVESAVRENRKLDISQNVEVLADLLGVDLETMVLHIIEDLRLKDRLKEGIGTLSDEQRKITERVLRAGDVSDDFKRFDFESFIKDVDLGTLSGNEVK